MQKHMSLAGKDPLRDQSVGFQNYAIWQRLLFYRLPQLSTSMRYVDFRYPLIFVIWSQSTSSCSSKQHGWGTGEGEEASFTARKF